jgi:prepilin-type N-terminal cleavage/methylation domain-containing protein
MLGKISKMLGDHHGFTLIELMTVLIILGIILGIGVPKYLQVQATAAWEADEATIKNYAKAAETYAATTNKYGDGSTAGKGVTIQTLIAAGLIGNDALNRVNDGSGNSKKNEDGTTIDTYNAQEFLFNPSTGTVNNLGKIIKAMIGRPPHGQSTDYPKYPNDKTAVVWTN